MLLNQIEITRGQLHSLINQNASYDSIYLKSVELDMLISEYYNRQLRRYN